MNRRVTELISAAELNLEERQFAAALEKLKAAEQIEPDNKSVEMMRDLIHSLQGTPQLKKRPLRPTIARQESSPEDGNNTLSSDKHNASHSKRITSLFERLRQGKFLR